MNLYHAITFYQLQCCIVHKLYYHINEEADLLISNTLVDKIVDMESLKNEKLFKHIAVLNYTTIKHSTKSSALSQIEEQCESVILNNLPIYKEIYVAGYHYYFGLLLAHNHIAFNIFEEACGLLSQAQVLDEIVGKISINWRDIVTKEGLIDASNKCIKRKLCNMKAQTEDFSDSHAVNFDVVELFEKISEMDQKLVLDIFGTPRKIDVPDNSVLILTQQFANLGLMSWDSQVLIYQLITDYFLEKYNIIIKAHPYDLMYYNVIFPKSIIIESTIPSELLVNVFSRLPECVAVISSTSIKTIGYHFNQKLEFDFAFEKQFLSIHRYYVAMKYISEILQSEHEIHLLRANSTILENFKKFYGLKFQKIVKHREIIELYSIPSQSIVLMDDDIDNPLDVEQFCEFLEQRSEDTVCILLNSCKQYAFYAPNHKHIFEALYPIEITKQALREPGEEMYQNLTPETIYIYTKGNHVSMKCMEKELTYTGVKISAKELEGDKLRIKILEGILDATEQRLLHYIKREHELSREIRELKGENER